MSGRWSDHRCVRSLWWPYPISSRAGPSKKGPKGPELFPTEEAIQLGDDFYDDEFWSDDNCKLVTFNETFFFFTASSSVAAGADTQAPGSMFIFNQPIYQLDGTEVPYVTLSGICTRTVTSDDAGLGGAGTCQLTFVDTTGNYTIATQGYLGLDANSASAMTAGSLVITGGSGSMVSVLGEMNVIPMDGDGMFLNGDVLADAYAYYVEAALGVIICPSPYHLDQYQY